VAIADIVYACIECGGVETLRPAGDAETCERCGTRYCRVDGALIRAERPGRPPETRSAGEWLDLLAAIGADSPHAIRPAPVLLRIADRQRPHRAAGMYLGRIESFGPELEGVLSLAGDRLAVQTEAARFEWSLLELTAVQPSSRALQLKVRNGPLLSFKFPEGSAVLWETRVQRALQDLYTSLGRGTIIEFQPRIVTR